LGIIEKNARIVAPGDRYLVIHLEKLGPAGSGIWQ
jgi:hypothetical protein